MKPLDDRERRAALLGALGAVAVSLALNVTFLPEKLPFLRLGVGVLMAAFLAGAAQRRSRVLTGVATFLLAFGPWGGAWVVGAAYLVLGMWLWFRGKPSPEEIAERRAARDAVIAERRAAKAAKRGGGGAGRGGRGGEPDVPGAARRPPPSKRYTPPARKR
jgi:putative Ca2+/H+ antiporter (TMEM165/GDT1 family)